MQVQLYFLRLPPPEVDLTAHAVEPVAAQLQILGRQLRLNGGKRPGAADTSAGPQRSRCSGVCQAEVGCVDLEAEIHVGGNLTRGLQSRGSPLQVEPRQRITGAIDKSPRVTAQPLATQRAVQRVDLHMPNRAGLHDPSRRIGLQRHAAGPQAGLGQERPGREAFGAQLQVPTRLRLPTEHPGHLKLTAQQVRLGPLQDDRAGIIRRAHTARSDVDASDAAVPQRDPGRLQVEACSVRPPGVETDLARQLIEAHLRQPQALRFHLCPDRGGGTRALDLAVHPQRPGGVGQRRAEVRGIKLERDVQ